MIFKSKEALSALVDQLREEDAEATRPEPHHVQYKAGWRPRLNPIQQQAKDSKAIYKLYYGERGSGKSHLGVHEIVDYCYRNDNCLAFIILKEFAMGTEGGAWNKLLQDVLPEWQQGIGIIHTETRYDPQTKKPYVWISNMHGHWSMIMLASLPVAHQVEGKIRGREPQIILVDEAQTLETDTYFTSLLMQLGRRQGSDDPSKIIFCCNPEGPSHWLYKRFFEMPVNEETGAWDSRYGHFHIPVSDNLPNLPPGYYENYVLPAVKNDPIMKARLVDGEWVDRPEGDSLFEGAWSDLFVKGDAVKNMGLLPVPPHPMIVSYDLGGAHSSIHFKQIVPTLDKIYRLCVDELDFVGQYTPYAKSIPLVIQRMLYWEEKMKFEFVWHHISDSSAFNMYRAEGGSYDVWDVEKISRAYVEKNNLSPRFIIRMKECPKGEFSIEARVRLVTDALVSGSTLISATCRKTREMFMRLPHDPKDRLRPKAKNRYIHNFDSYSYGDFYFSTRRAEVPGVNSEIKPQYYSV